MTAFGMTNYGLRPSKSIQRQIVFEGIRILHDSLDVENAVYVGLGSIWFVDFVMAHKILSINDMISIELDSVGCCRAKYNSPFATVNVQCGSSREVLPKLLHDPDIKRRPWVVWLDYDGEFNEDVAADVQEIVEGAPGNSIFLITFNGDGRSYGKPNDRAERIRELFGSVVPADLSKEKCGKKTMQRTLTSITTDFMKALALEARRPGGFFPAFQIAYRDSTPMVTVGGVLPINAKRDVVGSVINAHDWRCRPDHVLAAPHLTIREAMALQSTLPDPNGLTRERVRKLGFDLKENQIQLYERYYREYPSFAEVVT